jgi:hypothetical protein
VKCVFGWNHGSRSPVVIQFLASNVMKDSMKRSIALTLALGLALAAPFYANAQSNGGAAVGSSSPSPGNSENSAPVGSPALGGAPTAGGMTAQPQSHPTDGTSRHKSDCVKTGCVDSGGG